MRHIKNLSRVNVPAVASESGPTIFDCISFLIDTGDVEGFKECLTEKFNKGAV